MRIVIFGKNGQLSKALQKIIEAEVVSKKQVNFLYTNEIINYFNNNKFDLIINAAAYNNVEEAETCKEKAYLINAEAPNQLAKIANIQNIPLIHFSSDYVFDGSGEIPWKPEDKTNPISEYGKSKELGELKIIQSKCKNIIVRTSWLFSNQEKNFVNRIIVNSKNQDKISVVGDQFSGPTFVGDLANYCKILIHHLKSNTIQYGIYHYSGYPYVSRFEFAKKILNKINSLTEIKKISSDQSKLFQIRPKNSRLDCKKNKRLFNIEMPNWEVSLNKILDSKFYEKNK